MTKTHCGYVAILGRPNMGKSTLLNAMVGQKIAGVSAKPQTTRNRILGITCIEDRQILFLDTPGIHRSQKKEKLNTMMNREAWTVVSETDLVLYLVDSLSGWQDTDDDFFTNILKTGECPVMLVLSKVDRLKRQAAQAMAGSIQQRVEELLLKVPESGRCRLQNSKPILASAKDKELLQALGQKIGQLMPEGPWLYPDDDLTDRPQKFVVGELIREKVFRLLGEELPYHAAVVVESLEWGETLVKVGASIIVARASHKGMVIGKGGSKIKEIGTASRESLEKHFGQQVFLDLEVVVDEDWTNNETLIAQYSSLDFSKLN
ncbi:MAG: GTPase Era [Oligoflexus sp.]